MSWLFPIVFPIICFLSRNVVPFFPQHVPISLPRTGVFISLLSSISSCDSAVFAVRVGGRRSVKRSTRLESARPKEYKSRKEQRSTSFDSTTGKEKLNTDRPGQNTVTQTTKNNKSNTSSSLNTSKSKSNTRNTDKSSDTASTNSNTNISNTITRPRSYALRHGITIESEKESHLARAKLWIERDRLERETRQRTTERRVHIRDVYGSKDRADAAWRREGRDACGRRIGLKKNRAVKLKKGKCYKIGKNIEQKVKQQKAEPESEPDNGNDNFDLFTEKTCPTDETCATEEGVSTTGELNPSRPRVFVDSTHLRSDTSRSDIHHRPSPQRSQSASPASSIESKTSSRSSRAFARSNKLASSYTMDCSTKSCLLTAECMNRCELYRKKHPNEFRFTSVQDVARSAPPRNIYNLDFDIMAGGPAPSDKRIGRDIFGDDEALQIRNCGAPQIRNYVGDVSRKYVGAASGGKRGPGRGCESHQLTVGWQGRFGRSRMGSDTGQNFEQHCTDTFVSMRRDRCGSY